MDQQQDYKQFLTHNKDAFRKLKELMNSVDTVQGLTTVQEMRGRQIAINIVKNWLAEVWNIAYSEIPEPEPEDDIIRLISK